MCVTEFMTSSITVWSCDVG